MEITLLTTAELKTIGKIRRVHRLVAGLLIVTALIFTTLCAFLVFAFYTEVSRAPAYAYVLLFVLVVSLPTLGWWLAVGALRKLPPLNRVLREKQKTVVAGIITSVKGDGQYISYALDHTSYRLKLPFTGLWAVRRYFVTHVDAFIGEPVKLSYLPAIDTLLSVDYPKLPVNKKQVLPLTDEDRANLRRSAWRLLKLFVGWPIIGVAVIYFVVWLITGMDSYVWIAMVGIVAVGMLLFVLPDLLALLRSTAMKEKVVIRGMITEKIEIGYYMGKGSRLTTYRVRIGNQLLVLVHHDKKVGEERVLEFALKPDDSLGSEIVI